MLGGGHRRRALPARRRRRGPRRHGAGLDRRRARGDGAESLSPVVLADVPGLRDYRQRLSRFNSRDPFKQQMTGDRRRPRAAAATSSRPASARRSIRCRRSTSSASTQHERRRPARPTTSTDSGTSTGTSTPPARPRALRHDGSGRPEDRLIVKTTIDVRVGAPARRRCSRASSRCSSFPATKRPVVQFVEGDVDGTHAGLRRLRRSSPVARATATAIPAATTASSC